MRRPLVILGAGGFAREVADVVRDLGDACGYELIGFADRDSSRAGEMLNDLSILGSLQDVATTPGLCAVAAAGEIAPRARQIAEIESAGLTLATLIHPKVVVSPFVTIGEGTVITAGVIVTNGITIGRNVVLNLGVTVGHDAAIGSNVVVSPGAHISGWCTLEDECYIGTGAVLLPRVRVGRGAVVGAGAVVNRDVPAGSTVVGIPAKPLDTRRS